MITVIVCPFPHITDSYIVTSATEINLYTEQTTKPG